MSEMSDKMKSDPVAFVETVGDMTLQPWQSEMLRALSNAKVTALPSRRAVLVGLQDIPEFATITKTRSTGPSITPDLFKQIEMIWILD